MFFNYNLNDVNYTDTKQKNKPKNKNLHEYERGLKDVKDYLLNGNLLLFTSCEQNLKLSDVFCSCLTCLCIISVSVSLNVSTSCIFLL